MPSLDEDTMAVLFEYENGLAERLMRSRQAGSAQPFENVN